MNLGSRGYLLKEVLLKLMNSFIRFVSIVKRFVERGSVIVKMKKSISLCLLVSICCLQLVKSLPTTTTTTQAPNSTADSLFKNKNIPSYDAVCDTIVYTCKRKLPFGADLLTGTTADTSRPCVKYCIKYVLCDNGHKVRGKPNECVELNEQLVRAEFEKYKSEHKDDTHSIMPVAMIDFPCQPGFLPDGRGKCREAF